MFLLLAALPDILKKGMKEVKSVFQKLTQVFILTDCKNVTLYFELKNRY
jgi:hypothetical protein